VAQSVVSGVTLSTDTGAAATAGTHVITATGGVADNYYVTDADGVLTVDKAAALTVTANPQHKTYGDSDPVLSYTPSGTLYYNDSYAVISGVTLSTATGAAATAGTHAITAAGGVADNYYVTDADGVLTVDKAAALTVTANPQHKTYGDSEPVLSYTVTGTTYYSDVAQSVVSGVTLSTDTGAAATAGTHVITATGGVADNYYVTDANGVLTVDRRPITVTADAGQHKAYGQLDPALTYHISSGSLAYSDAFSGTLSRDPGEPVASYVIHLHTLTAGSNYNLTYVGDNFTITVPSDSISGAATTPEGSPYSLTLGTLPNTGLAAGDNVQFCVIHWGDGSDLFVSPSALGTGTGSGPTNLLPWPSAGLFTHTYADGTAATANTQISVELVTGLCDFSVPDMAHLTVNVQNVSPSAFIGGGPGVMEGQPSSVYFYNQSDPSQADLNSLRYAYDFNGDGTWDSGGSGTVATYATAVASSSVTVPANYLHAPSTTVTMRIFDKDDGYTTYTRVITVTNVRPTVSLVASATASTDVLFTSSGSFSDPGTVTTAGDPNKETYAGLVWYGDVTDPSGGSSLPLNSDGTFSLSHTYGAAGTYTVTVQVTDSNHTAGTASFAVNVSNFFQVTSFTATASGFDVAFNRPANIGEIHLYDGLAPGAGGTNTNFGEPASAGLSAVALAAYSDVTLLNPSGLPVKGSLVWDAATNTAQFVATSGVLTPGTYTLTLASRSSGPGSSDPGWEDTGSPGDPGDLISGSTVAAGFSPVTNGYQRTFNVAAVSYQRVLSIPNFARGPGQTANVAADGTAWDSNTSAPAVGLPVSISDFSNVTGFDFQLHYNPALLDISGVAFGSGVPASWGAPTFNIDPAHGTVSVSAGGGTVALTGSQVIVLTATVPTPAADAHMYGASQVLSLSNVTLASAPGTPALTGLGGESIEKVVNFGDVNGDGRVNSADAVLAFRIPANLDSGFYSAPLTDPVILADVSGDGQVDSQDANDMLITAVTSHGLIGRQGAVLQIPAVEFVPSAPGDFASVDPTVQIGSAGTVAQPGDTVPTSVRITDDPQGLEAASLTISYDTQSLSLADQDVTLGQGLAGKGWVMSENVNDAAGTVSVSMSGQPLIGGTPELLDLAFHVRSDAAAGTAPLAIAGSLSGASPLGMTVVDGSIVVVAAAPQTVVAGTVMPVADSVPAPAAAPATTVAVATAPASGSSTMLGVHTAVAAPSIAASPQSSGNLAGLWAAAVDQLAAGPQGVAQAVSGSTAVAAEPPQPSAAAAVQLNKLPPSQADAVAAALASEDFGAGQPAADAGATASLLVPRHGRKPAASPSDVWDAALVGLFDTDNG
jgi:hypothetical protein